MSTAYPYLMEQEKMTCQDVAHKYTFFQDNLEVGGDEEGGGGWKLWLWWRCSWVTIFYAYLIVYFKVNI